MRGAARFDADARRRQLGKGFLDRAAPDLPPQNRLFVLVNPMHLKDMLGRIQTNSDNRHADGSFGCVVTTSQPGTIRCRRGPSTPTGAPNSVRLLLGPRFRGDDELACSGHFLTASHPG